MPFQACNRKNSRFREFAQRYLAWYRAVSDIPGRRSQTRRKQKFSAGHREHRGYPSGLAETFSKFLSASWLFDRPVPPVGMAEPSRRDHPS